jgi:sigma-54 dependent transcriptional regulator, acetoin dehydrogenase operon transcriptional activator AcoR
VRELRNVVSGLHYLAKSRRVQISDLPKEITTPIDAADAHAPAAGDPHERLARISSLKHAEVILIENTLAHHRGNISKAATALGISRPTLYRKIEAFGINGATGDGPAHSD